MRFEYTLTFTDFKSAQSLHYRQTLGRRLKFAVWNIGVPILAVIGLAAFIFLDLSRITHYAAILFGIECALLWIAIANPIVRYYKMRKCFRQLFPPLRTEKIATLEINDDHLLSGIPGVSEGKFFWNGIVDFAQDDKVTLIYVAKSRFVFFPTAAMSPDQRVELNDLVSRYMAKGQPC
jgi:hypothetical protein